MTEEWVGGNSGSRGDFASTRSLFGWVELRAKVPLDEVVCGNLYYDALKAVLVGCTAFAVDTPTGPLHARNLDWWTENDSLRRRYASVR